MKHFVPTLLYIIEQGLKGQFLNQQAYHAADNVVMYAQSFQFNLLFTWQSK